MEVKKNIYQKLQNARVMLIESNIKKTGKNPFAKFTYYELSDFLPEINKINKDLGIFSQIIMHKEFFELLIFNCDNNDEKLSFISMRAEATMKGATPIQMLGAEQTYQRRYLYMMAYEISENDIIDALNNNEKNKTPNPLITNKNINDQKKFYDMDIFAIEALKMDLNKIETEDEVNQLYINTIPKGFEPEKNVINLFSEKKKQILDNKNKQKQENQTGE